VAAGAGDGDAEAAAAEGSCDYGVGASTFEGERGGDTSAVRAVGEDVAHAAEVTFAFFAYVGGEEDGDWRLDVGVAKGGGEGEQGGEACGVIADAGGEDAWGFGIFDGVTGGSCGEDGVEVGGDEEAGRRLGLFCRGGCEFCEDVAFVVEVDVGEAELVEALEEPGGAGVLGKGGRGDADQFKLPEAELRLVQMQPVEGAVNGGEAGEAGDSTVSGGGGH
jgi:hypothetical protein